MGWTNSQQKNVIVGFHKNNFCAKTLVTKNIVFLGKNNFIVCATAIPL